MSEGPLCCLWALEIPVCTGGGFILVCVCWGGGGMRGWHPTHKNVSTQVMAGAYDQIFTSFLHYCSAEAHTHRHTTPANTFPLDPEKSGDGSGKGFRRGDCFNSI